MRAFRLTVIFCLALILFCLWGCGREPVMEETLVPELPELFLLPDGRQVPADTESLDLSSTPKELAERCLSCIPSLSRLRSLELGGEEIFSAQQVAELQETRPEIDLSWRCTIAGKEVNINAPFLDLSQLDGEELESTAERMRLMKELRTVELGQERENGLSWEDILVLEQAAPQAEFLYAFTLYGHSFSLQDEEMDLNHIPISDEGETVSRIIPCMPRLRYLCMDSCGVSDESMEIIRDSNPGVDVVWRIWFGKCYSVRTDVEKILASMPGEGGNLQSGELNAKLKYCTRLKYLDLGHNGLIEDIGFVSYMPDLEVLILAMNKLGDLSPLAQCPKLEYLELFMSYVYDLEPLRELGQLRHLNIGMCPMLKDLSPLYGLELERLYIGTGTGIPAEQIQEYRRLHPSCEIDDCAYDTSVGAWRYTHKYDEDEAFMAKDYYRAGMAPRYALLRRQFGYDNAEYSFARLDPNY